MTESDDLSHLSELLSTHGYTLMRQIGSGSYGRVYTVLSHKYQGVVFGAKVMSLAGASASLFDTEIEILTQLSHPHIVSLFDAFRSGDDCILILEYCENGTIREYIRLQQLPQAHLIAMLKQVVSAVAYCHSNGVALRDIKPANILIDHYGRPKLADFGLSCFVQCKEGPHHAGSLAYMAPELFGARHETDLFSADIWSLGITIYVLFVGELPWPRISGTAQLITMIATGAMPEIPESLSAQVRGILGKMIVRDPAARAPAAELLKDELFLGAEQFVGRGRDSAHRRVSASPGVQQRIMLGRPSVANLPLLKRGSQQSLLTRQVRPTKGADASARRNSAGLTGMNLLQPVHPGPKT
jgi:serine/threonine protein kinase